MNRKEFISHSAIASAILLLDQSCIDKNNNKVDDIQIKNIPDTHSKEIIAYLLRRTTFGYTSEQLALCQQLGLYKTIDLLFEAQATPKPPVNFEFQKDIYTPFGETWVDKPYLMKTFFEQYRKKSIQAWIMEVINIENISIREQLTLFWHNHFGVSDIVEHKVEYIHNELLRTNYCGNYKELVKKVTIDPAMLRFLSGFDNTKQAPNENYARELLELFTIGKGKLVGNGDYTNYTEEDIRQIAKSLTGWTDVGWYNFYKEKKIGAKFDVKNHDKSNIKLSYRFDHKRIPPVYGQRYKRVIDIIFEKEETSKFIVRKLYRWFVDSEINDEIEFKLIKPLSNQLIENNFELKDVIISLLKSSFFYSITDKAPKIKNPLEYTFNILKYFPFKIPNNLELKYNFWHQVFTSNANMAMEYFKPPSVAGWKAYYQSPLYYRTWINAATLQNRRIFCAQFFKEGFKYENNIVKMDYKYFISEQIFNLNPENMINSITDNLFQLPIQSKEKEIIINLILNGIERNEWTQITENYLKNKTNLETDKQIEEGMANGLFYLFSMPEYQIS